MSATERAHSKLYRYQTGIGEDLDVKTRNSGQDVTLQALPPARVLSATPITLEQFLTKKLCGPDAVIVGSVQSRTSQLTENRKSVFSELSVSVDQVVKDNPQASIGKGDTVLITRSGGTILLNNRKVDVQPPGGHLQRGVSYLFFLKYLPDTNSYAVDDLDLLQVHGQTLSDLPNIQDKSFDSISLSQLTTFASTSCAKSTGASKTRLRVPPSAAETLHLSNPGFRNPGDCYLQSPGSLHRVNWFREDQGLGRRSRLSSLRIALNESRRR